jgi:excinuclease ABC subunit C
MAVLIDSELSPSHYRHFKIRWVKGQDDCAMLEEVTERRLKYLDRKSNGTGESFYQKPDLMVIDGGKAQFSAVGSVLEKKGFKDIDLISIAKKEEMIFSGKFKNGIRFDTGSEVLRNIIKLRDEAHRFAISYHRRLREKYMTNSILDQIKGIGEKKKAYILGSVDSIDDLKEMSIERIANIKGISYKDAVNIYDSFNR